MSEESSGRTRSGKKIAAIVSKTHAAECMNPSSACVEVNRTREKRVRNYRRHAKGVIAENFVTIMTTMAEKSNEGSLSHTKYLFEIGGVKEDIQRQGQGKPEPSLAELLLAEVKKRQGARLLTAGETPPDAGSDKDEEIGGDDQEKAVRSDGESND